MNYTVEYRPAVLKSLRKVPKRELLRIKRVIEEISANLPDPTTTKLKGHDLHKVRSGNYRVIYEIQDARLVILIVKIGHRKDVYDHLP